MVLSRNKAQEIAMTLIYNALTLMKVDEALDVEALITRYFDEPYEDIDVFVKEILIKMVRYQTVMTDHISSHLKNCTFDRIT